MKFDGNDGHWIVEWYSNVWKGGAKILNFELEYKQTMDSTWTRQSCEYLHNVGMHKNKQHARIDAKSLIDPKGEYVFRVRSNFVDGKQSLFSPVQVFKPTPFASTDEHKNDKARIDVGDNKDGDDDNSNNSNNNNKSDDDDTDKSNENDNKIELEKDNAHEYLNDPKIEMKTIRISSNLIILFYDINLTLDPSIVSGENHVEIRILSLDKNDSKAQASSDQSKQMHVQSINDNIQKAIQTRLKKVELEYQIGDLCPSTPYQLVMTFNAGPSNTYFFRTLSKPNFTGHWSLHSNVNLDPFLKSEGWLWVARKMAATANIDQSIYHDVKEKTFSNVVAEVRGCYQYQVTIDKDFQEYCTLSNEKAKIKACWKDSTQCVLDEVRAYPDGHQIISERWLFKDHNAPHALRMTLHYVNQHGVTLTRIFQKEPDDTLGQ
ncbi:hypothetical protein RFI_14117 [Reticulomyxa filosa]|uniref:Uncharacterized protein n=1 Tax=Reticulomyxa filosa TaxID=46433 RepID=X6NAK6_RETFI|nr:hypothetical protein RFI_14117 [Reticulomyxa filosa]|eukprot:ETO23066.1 hypothetical protein RFI_14117 [Reticulomyxa filosa]